MSYILQALKQSEKDRQQVRTQEERPVYDQQTVKPNNRRWRAISALLFIILLILAGLLFIKDPQKTERQKQSNFALEKPIEESRLESAAKIPVAQDSNISRPKTAPKVHPLSAQAQAQPPKLAEQKNTRFTELQQETPMIQPEEITEDALDTNPNTTDGSKLQNVKAVTGVEINVHVYSPEPRKRFVFLNGHKHKEGERLSGTQTTLETITENGVILDLGDRKVHLQVNN